MLTKERYLLRRYLIGRHADGSVKIDMPEWPMPIIWLCPAISNLQHNVALAREEMSYLSHLHLPFQSWMVGPQQARIPLREVDRQAIIGFPKVTLETARTSILKESMHRSINKTSIIWIMPLHLTWGIFHSKYTSLHAKKLHPDPPFDEASGWLIAASYPPPYTLKIIYLLTSRT